MGAVYWFNRAAKKKYHGLGALNNRHFPHSSGGQKSEIRVAIKLVSEDLSPWIEDGYPSVCILTSFYLIKMFLSRSIVDLQCCISFRHTETKFGYTYIFFSDLFPSQVITKHLVQFPMLYSRYLLVIYLIYHSIYMLIPNLRCICPSFLSPLVTLSFCFYFVGLFLFYI